MLTAPTGKAAVNIGGTLHNALKLPIKQRGSRFEFTHPGSASLNTMKANYCQLRILIIDEVSMVRSQTFSNLNFTLQEIFENEKIFGGLSILAVGDLMQLNPVGEKPIYKALTTGYATPTSSVWSNFSIFELEETVRQKYDPAFAQLLSRVREGKHTTLDISILKSLENNSVIPQGCLSIFLTNALKDIYHVKQLNLLSSEVFCIRARDTKRFAH